MLADSQKNLPPRLGKKRGIICIRTVERPARSQIQDHHLPDPHAAQLVHLPAQAGHIQTLTAPPPNRRRRKRRIGNDQFTR